MTSFKWITASVLIVAGWLWLGADGRNLGANAFADSIPGVDDVQTMTWTDADVEVPHWSTAVAVMTGWAASDPLVESHTVLVSPVPREPSVFADQRISTESPSGSDAEAESSP